MTTFSIKKDLSIKVLPDIVFDALTSSDKIVQYYPLKEVISSWKVGSEIILKGNDGKQDFTDYGIIEFLSPNKRFQYTYWSDNHGTDRTPENHLTICYTLREAANGTDLELEQKNLKSEDMYLGMLGVWDFLLSNLKNFVEKNS